MIFLCIEDLRLTSKGLIAGCIGKQREEHFRKRKADLVQAIEILESLQMPCAEWKTKLVTEARITKAEVKSAFQMLRHPDISIEEMVQAVQHMMVNFRISFKSNSLYKSEIKT